MVEGHKVRGPMWIFCKLRIKEVSEPEIKTTYQYVLDLKNRLQSTFQLAKDNPERSFTYCNERAGQRDMKKDEKVLDLLPTSNKLLIRVERTLQNSSEGRKCRL